MTPETKKCREGSNCRDLRTQIKWIRPELSVIGGIKVKIWFRDVDSNHDTQLQRLMSYQLDDPGTGLQLDKFSRGRFYWHVE